MFLCNYQLLSSLITMSIFMSMLSHKQSDVYWKENESGSKYRPPTPSQWVDTTSDKDVSAGTNTPFVWLIVVPDE